MQEVGVLVEAIRVALNCFAEVLLFLEISFPLCGHIRCLGRLESTQHLLVVVDNSRQLADPRLSIERVVLVQRRGVWVLLNSHRLVLVLFLLGLEVDLKHLAE